ncbi:extracellular solute-binding protein [Micromonospora sp. DR5-3]|uniref:extracellular solute-binding protein n=1 Tax=unclassified Micromonospora TaxID=2617518 RepID=UPI001CA35F07|nr:MULTISPECIES: extracellular solute-binding protein [unclassified Micromonospora]MCW3815977.1 extracellular solute-binding protein [Micromonospora sp. DR5-3]
MALTGCSGSAAEQSGKEFTYWSMWKSGEPQQKVLADAIADFEQQHNVKIKVQWQGRTNLQKLVPALNTNDVPDLVDGPYLKMYPALAATKQALGLGEAYATQVDGKPAGELIPAKLLQNINIKYPDGQPWMLPYQIQSDAVWFNAAKHPELKTNPPKTWGEFIALLDRLKAAGETPIAADGDVAGYNAAYFGTMVLRESGPGALMKLASDKSGAAWDDPAVLDAAKKVEQLVKGGYFIKGYQASKFPAQQQKWANNGAALMFMGSWMPTESASYAAAGFEFGSFPFPTTGSQDSQRADVLGFAVPKKAKNAKLAQEFAAFFLGKKYQDASGAEAKMLPIRSDATTAPELADVKATLDNASAYHQQLDGVAFPGYNEKVLSPNDDELFLGKISAEQFVSKMKAAQIAYWKTQN